MSDISVKLMSKNSSGSHELHLTSDNGEYWFTLTGTKAQIDFEELTKSELIDIHAAIGLILEES